MAMDSFIFGGDTGLNYQQLQQRRAIAAALAGRQKGFPKTKGEGLTYLGESIAEGLGDLRLQMMERAQRAKEAEIKAKAPSSNVAGSDERYDEGRPKEVVKDQPEVKTPVVDQPYFTEPTAIPVAAPAPASEWVQSAPVEPWPGEGPSAAPAPAPAPEPVTDAAPATVAERLAAANVPLPGAIPVQPTTEPPVQTARAAPTQQQSMFFSPQMQASLAGGNVPPVEAMQALKEIQSPAQTAQLPPDQVTLPTETRDIPLPMGNPRTTGGVRATMEAVLARGGYSPNAIGGIERNVRDESSFNPNLRHPDQPNFSGEARYAHGLYQEGGDEWNNYVKWIDKNAPGSDWRDPKLQTQFLAERMQERPDYQAMSARMNAAPNTGVAANEFLRGYLKPAEQYREARGAQYLREGGQPTAYASRDITGGAGAGPAIAGARVANTAPGREGGAPIDVRDQVAAALVAQQQPGATAAAPQEDTGGGDVDPRIREALGGRRPGSPFYAPTAALGRAGVATDAPSLGASPMGGGTRDSITDTLMRQQPQPSPVTAPAVPPPDPTQSGTTQSPTTASLPPSTSGVVSSDVVQPMGATAQLGVPLAPPVGFGNMRVAQEPGPAMPVQPPAPRDTSQGIQLMPPSQEPIPPSAFPKYPDPGPEPVRPRPVPETKAQRYWSDYMHNPNVSKEMQLHAEEQYKAQERYRAHQEELQQQDYVDKREKWQERVKRKEEEAVKEPERVIKQAIDRLTIQKAQAEAARNPLEVKKLENEIEVQKQALEKGRDEAFVRKEYGNLPQEAVIKIVGDSRDTATKAVIGFQAVQNAKAAIARGAITGFGADARLNWAKFNQWMGLEDRGNDIANTEVFRSSMAPAIAATLKATVGTTQISNTDRQFAEDAAGGRISLDAQTISRLLDVTNRLSLEAMGKHQTLVDAMYGNNPKAQALFAVDPPIPEHHVQRLLENRDSPEYIKDFDKAYYRGAAKRILQRGY